MKEVNFSPVRQDIKIGWSGTPHQQYEKQVGPVSVWCDKVGYLILCPGNGIEVLQQYKNIIGTSATKTRYHCDVT